MEGVFDLRFHQATGHDSVIALWEGLFEEATMGLQAAVCYATEPGIAVLSKAARQIALGDGFFVASVEYPTNIDALHQLHQMAPGHVYIHLGYESPRTNDEAKQLGYALMHSKMILANKQLDCQLWVGSHNLTARAMSGANLEAGVLVRAAHSSQVVLDARRHLMTCRESAELFNPARIDVYKAVQARRMAPGLEVENLAALVIHAEADESMRQVQMPFIVHLCLVPHTLDSYFLMDRDVRLFLHPRGSLAPGRPVDMSLALGWKGMQTAIARTERHPLNKGINGQFEDAHFQVFVRDLRSIPAAVYNDQDLTGKSTQVVMRFTQEAAIGTEAYSVRSGAERVRMETQLEQPAQGHVDRRLARSFRTGSVQDGELLFKRITGVEPMLMLEAYESTRQPLLLLGGGASLLEHASIEPRNPIDPFFFTTKSVVRMRTE